LFSPRFEQLVQQLRVLPGVGPKSAQRMALHLLSRNREGGLALAQALEQAMVGIRQCRECRSYAEAELCELCASGERDPQVLCVVESAADVAALENSGVYRGRYHVLGGRLSPLDGLGPEQLGIPALVERIRQQDIEELILATNATVEGQATAHYLQEAVRHLPVRVSRIAQGVPLGGELEYVDSHTLRQALQHRLTWNRETDR
jgi:recombination protein RecR